MWYINAKKICVDIAKDFETRSGTFNYELEGPLTKRKNEKVIGLTKDELGEKTMAESITLKQKIYSNLTDDNDENKKKKKGQKSLS